jgi:RNA polymerase sigma-70 factor (ECF subfamily)
MHRPHLIAVATRLLGSPTEAEDAVQEAWFRLDRTGDDGIENLGGWLTTVVSRICLDHLRTRSSRKEEAVDDGLAEPPDDEPGPEDVAVLSESTAEALAVVLDTLTPVERVAFVLHDVFDVPFDDIATIVDRSPAATRQLASRARRKAQAGSVNSMGSAPRSEEVRLKRELVAAFFAASRSGRLDTLIQLLAPGVVLRTDAVAAAMGAKNGWLTGNIEGADAVAKQFAGRAEAARLAMIDGQYGAAWVTGGKPRVVFLFTAEGDQIASVSLVADPEAIAAMEIEILDA